MLSIILLLGHGYGPTRLRLVRVVLGYVSVEPWDPTRRVFPLQLATVTTYVRRPNYYLRVRVVSLRLSSHTQAQASTIYTSIRYTSKARARWQRPGSFPRV